VGKNKASLLQARISSTDKQNKTKPQDSLSRKPEKQNNLNSSFLVLIYVMFKICVHIINNQLKKLRGKVFVWVADSHSEEGSKG